MDLHEIFLASEIARKSNGNGESVDLSDYYTKSQTDGLLVNKIDKADGMGLSENSFTDAEKTKLSGLDNYDDTQIKAETAETTEQTVLNRSTLGYQRKNLLDTINFSTANANGAVINANPDGTYSLSGLTTNTADYFYTPSNVFSKLYGLKKNCAYTISSGDPKIIIRVDYSNNSDSWTGIIVENVQNSATFTVPDDATGLFIRFRSKISTNLNGVILKPMLRYAEITDDTYEPYTPSVKEYIDDLIARVTALEESRT